jgi:hypothetical protein
MKVSKEELLECPYCGESCRNIFTVEYDGMVDGPGQTMSDERCEKCAPEDGGNG